MSQDEFASGGACSREEASLSNRAGDGEVRGLSAEENQGKQPPMYLGACPEHVSVA